MCELEDVWAYAFLELIGLLSAKEVQHIQMS